MSSLMHSNEKSRCAIPCANRAFMDDVEADLINPLLTPLVTNLGFSLENGSYP